MQKISNYEREKAIYRYVQALDNGDLDSVAEVLELALCDQELERIIEEIDLAYQEEEGITPTATDAAIVRDLIHQHLHSAFEGEGRGGFLRLSNHLVEKPDSNKEKLVANSSGKLRIQPITVGDVARHLQQRKSFKSTENELLESLLNSSVLIPSSPSLKEIEQLFIENLQLNVNRRFIDNFRKVAIKLGMGRSYSNAQLAAARQQKKNYKSTNK